MALRVRSRNNFDFGWDTPGVCAYVDVRVCSVCVCMCVREGREKCQVWQESN